MTYPAGTSTPKSAILDSKFDDIMNQILAYKEIQTVHEGDVFQHDNIRPMFEREKAFWQKEMEKEIFDAIHRYEGETGNRIQTIRIEPHKNVKFVQINHRM